MRTNLASIPASRVSEEVAGSSVSNAGEGLAALLAASSAYSVLHGMLETSRLGGVASTSTWKSQFLWLASNRSSRCALKVMGSLRVYSQLPAQTHANKRLVLLGQRFKSVHLLENAVLLRSLNAPASHTGAYESTVPSQIRCGSLKACAPRRFPWGHTRVSLSSLEPRKLGPIYLTTIFTITGSSFTVTS